MTSLIMLMKLSSAQKNWGGKVAVKVPRLTCGPPITKRPLGCRWYMVSSSRYPLGIMAFTTCSFRQWRISSKLTPSSCCTETTTVWTRSGTMAPRSCLYWTVTWEGKTTHIRFTFSFKLLMYTYQRALETDPEVMWSTTLLNDVKLF